MTLNNNVNNYVVTMTGAASTLDGESTLTYDGSTLNVGVGNSGNRDILLQNNSGYLRLLTSGSINSIQSGTQAVSDSKAVLTFGSALSGTEWMRVDTLGNLNIGTTSTISTSRLNVYSGNKEIAATIGNAKGRVDIAVADVTADYSNSAGSGDTVIRALRNDAGGPKKLILQSGLVTTGKSGIVISDTNLVGIGTASPTRRLDVDGSYEFFHNPTTELTGDGGYGDVVTFGTYSAGTTFNCYYFASTGTWTATDADSVTSATGLIGMALGTSISTGILLRGYVENASWGWTTGATLYLSTTLGGLQSTAPTGAGDIIRIVGYAINNNTIFFCPDNTWIEI